MDAIGNEHKMGKLEKVHDEEQGNEMAEGDESLGTPEEPIAQYVKLISSDKHVFIIEKLYVLISKKIREMLEVAGKIMHISIVTDTDTDTKKNNLD